MVKGVGFRVRVRGDGRRVEGEALRCHFIFA